MKKNVMKMMLVIAVAAGMLTGLLSAPVYAMDASVMEQFAAYQAQQAAEQAAIQAQQDAAIRAQVEAQKQAIAGLNANSMPTIDVSVPFVINPLTGEITNKEEEEKETVDLAKLLNVGGPDAFNVLVGDAPKDSELWLGNLEEWQYKNAVINVVGEGCTILFAIDIDILHAEVKRELPVTIYHESTWYLDENNMPRLFYIDGAGYAQPVHYTWISAHGTINFHTQNFGMFVFVMPAPAEQPAMPVPETEVEATEPAVETEEPSPITEEPSPVTEETSSVKDEVLPAAADENIPAAADEVLPATADETLPNPETEEPSPVTEETSPETDEVLPAATDETLPAAAETETTAVPQSEEPAAPQEEATEKKGFLSGFVSWLAGSPEEKPAEETPAQPSSEPDVETTEEPAAADEPAEAPTEEHIEAEPSESEPVPSEPSPGGEGGSPSGLTDDERPQAPYMRATEQSEALSESEVSPVTGESTEQSEALGESEVLPAAADETLPAAQESPEAEPEEQSEPESLPLTEEEQFTLLYPNYVDMYLKYGTAADFSAMPHEAYLKMLELFSTDSSTEEAAEAPYAESGVSDDQAEILTEQSSALPDNAEKKVAIRMLEEAPVTVGANVTLTAELEGFDQYSDFQYVWQADSGAGYQEVAVTDTPAFSFTATEDNLSWNWRLTVRCR